MLECNDIGTWIVLAGDDELLDARAFLFSDLQRDSFNVFESHEIRLCECALILSIRNE